VLCARAHGYRRAPLRRRASRPQLKARSLGSTERSNPPHALYLQIVIAMGGRFRWFARLLKVYERQHATSHPSIP